MEKDIKIPKSLKQKTFIQTFGTYIGIILVYIIVELLLKSGHISSLLKGLLVPLCTYSILAVSLNLVVGISGELSLGHAGFMCIGAFSSAIFTKLMKELGHQSIWIFIIAIIIAAIVAALFGFIIGIPVLRLRGDYLAIVTLAFGEIIKNVINAIYLGFDERGFHISLQDTSSLNLSEKGFVIIKGAQGITSAPKYSTFTIGVILLLITVFIVQNLIASRTGRSIMACRDNRIAAESVGINVTKYKMIAFTISASLAGIAGVLYAHNLSTLQALPKNFGYNMSITILVFVVLGGMGNIRGSIISACLLTLIPELLRELSNYRMLIYAIILIIMMLYTSAPAAIQYRDILKDRFFNKNKKNEEEGEVH